MVNLTVVWSQHCFRIGWKQGQCHFGGAASVCVNNSLFVAEVLSWRHMMKPNTGPFKVTCLNNVHMALWLCVWNAAPPLLTDMKHNKVRACMVSVHRGASHIMEEEDLLSSEVFGGLMWPDWPLMWQIGTKELLYDGFWCSWFHYYQLTWWTYHETHNYHVWTLWISCFWSVNTRFTLGYLCSKSRNSVY